MSKMQKRKKTVRNKKKIESSNIKILKNGIEATIIDNNEPVKAISTDDQRNKDLLETHNKLFTTSANEVKQVYSLQLESELYFEAVKFLYNYCWK